MTMEDDFNERYTPEEIFRRNGWVQRSDGGWNWRPIEIRIDGAEIARATHEAFVARQRRSRNSLARFSETVGWHGTNGRLTRPQIVRRQLRHAWIAVSAIPLAFRRR